MQKDKGLDYFANVWKLFIPFIAIWYPSVPFMTKVWFTGAYIFMLVLLLQVTRTWLSKVFSKKIIKIFDALRRYILSAAMLHTLLVAVLVIAIAFADNQSSQFTDYLVVALILEILILANIPKIMIIRATYGTEKDARDVTKELRKLIRKGKLSVVASNNIAGDPTPGYPKVLKIEYGYKGQKRTRAFDEGEKVELP